MIVFSSFLTICLLIFQCENVSATEIQLDRVELLNQTYMEGFYNLSEFRVTKFNRTSYVWNAEVEMFSDIDDKLKLEVTFHHNRLNNNQYNKSPMQISKDTLCNIAEKYYRKFIMNDIKDISNFPQLKAGEPVCPIVKGHYYIRNYLPNGNTYPAILPDGHWKAELVLYYEEAVFLVIHIYFKSITSKYGLM